MIVPGTRLLFWTALWIPFLAVSPLTGWTAWLAGILGGLLFCLAGIDAWWSHRGLQGLTLEFPDLVRLALDRDGAIDVRVFHEGIRQDRIRLALALPKGLTTPEEILSVGLPRDRARSHFQWPCRAERRGRLWLGRVRYEVDSRLGFWGLRRTVRTQTEIRVYPNLVSEGKFVAALFLNRGGTGIHALRQIGKGRDFEQLREYQSGDGFEDIHWKATAKRRHPVTKVYQVERTQEIYVVLDASRLSARPVPGPALNRRITILEKFISAALILGLAAKRQGDLFGLLTFSDRMDVFLSAKGGQNHYGACREALFSLEARPVSPDFTELFTFIGQRLTRRSLLLILTNMDDPILAEHFVQNVHLVSRRHLVLASMTHPPGAGPLFSPENPVATRKDMDEALAGHLIWTGLQNTQKQLLKKNVAFNILKSQNLIAELVSQYMDVKRRQAL